LTTVSLEAFEEALYKLVLMITITACNRIVVYICEASKISANTRLLS